MKFVILGLSTRSAARSRLAVNDRGLLRELDARGHEILVLERRGSQRAEGAAKDVSTRTSRKPNTSPYRSVSELKRRYSRSIREAHVVIVGPFVPDGAEVGKWVTRTAKGVTAFYDIDTPNTLAKLEHGDASYLTRALIPKYDLYLSVTGGPTVERMQEEFQSPMARELNGPPPYRAAQLERFIAEAMTGQLMA
jgi:spore maturation protein CgeB